MFQSSHYEVSKQLLVIRKIPKIRQLKSQNYYFSEEKVNYEGKKHKSPLILSTDPPTFR